MTPRARQTPARRFGTHRRPVRLARASAASTSSSTAAASASDLLVNLGAFDLASAALAPTPGGVQYPSSVPRSTNTAAAADLHRTASPGARSIASSSTVDPRALVAALDTSDGASSSATSDSSVRVVAA